MSAVIKKIIPEKMTEKPIPKPVPISEPIAKPITKPPVIGPMEAVKPTDGPSATEVDMSSGLDGITESLKRKKKGRSKTILTSSQGISDSANVVAPTLLG